MTMKKASVDRAGLTEKELDLIQQFEADYNAVDHFLRKNTGDEYIPFVEVVNEYSCKHPGWNDGPLLKTIAKVRNAIVHGKTEAYRYVAVPTPAAVGNLRACRNRLIDPPLSMPTFKRNVQTVSVGQSLADVLRLIALRDYSQFPAYEAQQFKGLLTENGVTRWLAKHVDARLSLVDFDEISVKEVISNESERTNFHFVAGLMRVDYVSSLFANNPLLEAVLITANGKDTEALLGIATRWDLIQPIHRM
jgi:predicted transcriptional regulator